MTPALEDVVSDLHLDWLLVSLTNPAMSVLDEVACPLQWCVPFLMNTVTWLVHLVVVHLSVLLELLTLQI